MAHPRAGILAGVILAACGGGEPPVPAVPPAPRMAWTTDLSSALVRAREEGRPILLAFVSDGSPSCRELEAGPFADPRVIEAAQPFIAVRVEIGADRATARAYRAGVVPDVRFLAADGREAGRMRNRGAGEAWDAAAVADQMRTVVGALSATGGP